MTDNSTAPVEQVDRDAVQRFHSEMAARLLSDIRHGTDLLDAKGEDSDPIYQAFARHRIEERERCAKVSEDHVQKARERIAECPKWSAAQAEHSRARDLGLDIVDAIRGSDHA